MGEVVCADDVCAFAVRGRIGLRLDITLRSFGRFWRPQDDNCLVIAGDLHRKLFGAEGDDWVDGGGAAGGDEAGQ